MAYGAAWGYALDRFPARVPVHFGAGGAVDGVADRGSALVGFAVLGGAVAVLFGALVLLTARMPLRRMNIPHRDWWLATPERRRQVRTLLAADLGVIGGATLVLLAVLLARTAQESTRPRPALGAPDAVVLVGWIGAVLGWAAWCLLRRYRPRP